MGWGGIGIGMVLFSGLIIAAIVVQARGFSRRTRRGGSCDDVPA